MAMAAPFATAIASHSPSSRIMYHEIALASDIDWHPSVFEVPERFKCGFSTDGCKKPKRPAKYPAPPPLARSDIKKDVEQKAAELRVKVPGLARKIYCPIKRWEDLWFYFDGQDLQTEGPTFLFYVINVLYRQNVILNREEAEQRAAWRINEVWLWAQEWIAANNDKVWNIPVTTDLTLLFTDEEKAGVSDLTAVETKVLVEALSHYHRDLFVQRPHLQFQQSPGSSPGNSRGTSPHDLHSKNVYPKQYERAHKRQGMQYATQHQQFSYTMPTNNYYPYESYAEHRQGSVSNGNNTYGSFRYQNHNQQNAFKGRAYSNERGHGRGQVKNSAADSFGERHITYQKNNDRNSYNDRNNYFQKSRGHNDRRIASNTSWTSPPRTQILEHVYNLQGSHYGSNDRGQDKLGGNTSPRTYECSTANRDYFKGDPNATVTQIAVSYYYNLTSRTKNREYHAQSTVFVGGAGLQSFVSHELRQMMEKAGPVDYICCLDTNRNTNSCPSFVAFQNAFSVKIAIENFNGYVMADGRTLTVTLPRQNRWRSGSQASHRSPEERSYMSHSRQESTTIGQQSPNPLRSGASLTKDLTVTPPNSKFKKPSRQVTPDFSQQIISKTTIKSPSNLGIQDELRSFVQSPQRYTGLHITPTKAGSQSNLQSSIALVDITNTPAERPRSDAEKYSSTKSAQEGEFDKTMGNKSENAVTKLVSQNNLEGHANTPKLSLPPRSDAQKVGMNASIKQPMSQTQTTDDKISICIPSVNIAERANDKDYPALQMNIEKLSSCTSSGLLDSITDADSADSLAQPTTTEYNDASVNVCLGLVDSTKLLDMKSSSSSSQLSQKQNYSLEIKPGESPASQEAQAFGKSIKSRKKRNKKRATIPDFGLSISVSSLSDAQANHVSSCLEQAVTQPQNDNATPTTGDHEMYTSSISQSALHTNDLVPKPHRMKNDPKSRASSPIEDKSDSDRTLCNSPTKAVVTASSETDDNATTPRQRNTMNNETAHNASYSKNQSKTSDKPIVRPDMKNSKTNKNTKNVIVPVASNASKPNSSIVSGQTLGEDGSFIERHSHILSITGGQSRAIEFDVKAIVTNFDESCQISQGRKVKSSEQLKANEESGILKQSIAQSLQRTKSATAISEPKRSIGAIRTSVVPAIPLKFLDREQPSRPL